MRQLARVLVLVVLGCWGIGFGGVLNQKQIASTSAWVVHADLNVFRASQIGQLVTAEIKAKHQEKIDALQVLLGSNLMTDLDSVTLYGPDAEESNVVSLIQGHYDREKLLAFLKLNPAYAETSKEGYTMYSWLDEKRNKEQVGTFAAEDLIIISQTPAALQTAMDVLAGKQPSLADKADEPLFSLTQAPEGAFLIAAAEGLSKLAGQEHAAILKNSNFMVFITGEQAGNLTAHLKLESETDESALQIEQVVRGMLAFMTLQMKDQPMLQKLLQSSVITRDGRKLEFKLSAPSQEVFDLVKSHAKFNLDANQDGKDKTVS